MSDAVLAPLYQQGVPGVLEVLRERHLPLFRQQAEGLARRGNRVTTDDLLQDHYIRLRVQHRNYDPTRALSATNPWQPWASTLLFRGSISDQRRGTRETEDGRQQRETTGRDFDAVAGHGDPVAEAIARELQSALDGCVARLPSNQQQVFLLNQAGRSNPEIAVILGISVEEVGRLLFHARRNLALCLAQNGYSEVNS